MADFKKKSYPSYPFAINQSFMYKIILPLSYPILPYLTQRRVTWVSEGKNKITLQHFDFQCVGNLGKIFHTFLTYKKKSLTH
jgi:hypothetical protein